MFVRQPDVTVPPPETPPHPYTFPLDPFQAWAFHAIANGENVLVCAKTGSGKTLVGEYQIHHSLQKQKRVFYTSPIKSLSNQKYYDLKRQYPQATVGIMTGDIKVSPDAQVVVMTTEILRNLLYKQGTATEHLGLTAALSLEDVDAVIFDECHYMNDPDRGHVWEETLTRLPPSIRMVLLSATLEKPERIADWLGGIKRHPIHLIQTAYRVVPLTHYVLMEGATGMEMRPYMDEKERYQPRVYEAWWRAQEKEERAYRLDRLDRERRVEEKERPKVRAPSSFVHRLNRTVAWLEEKELLPALVFLFRRKQCEQYAKQIERSLLDVADASAVRHILSFHLHRYQAELDATPQYHQLVELLYKGIAFHHSGLLPILKEVVEILFARGYIRLLFATETFAVGLNMPTKTVVFASLTKYDDRVEGMRVLRSDEYFQMAGRAGRRGKDTRGVVLYVPEERPLTPGEMSAMMGAARPMVTSRMTFGAEFVLKALHASPTVDWVAHLEETYGGQERARERRAIEGRITALDAERRGVWESIGEPYRTELMDVQALEVRRKTASDKKAIQRQIDSFRNRQVGPKWKKAAEDLERVERLDRERRSMEEELDALGAPLEELEYTLQALERMGFIADGALTAKGVMATEINEGHPVVLVEYFLSGAWESLDDLQSMMVLTAFLEPGDHENHGPLPLLEPLERMADALELDPPFRASRMWAEPMRMWWDGYSAAEIAEYAGVFEGNVYRALGKLINVVNEVMTLATMTERVGEVDKWARVSERLRRSAWTGESLYLRL
jgi:superfamily II RNA helicase